MSEALSDGDIDDILGFDFQAASPTAEAGAPQTDSAESRADSAEPQADLAAPRTDTFAPSEALSGLMGRSVVYYRFDFLPWHLADRYFEALRPGGAAGVGWERRAIVLYGREVREGRSTAFYGDPGTSYRYSGVARSALPWSADPSGTLVEILAAARAATGRPFNFVLANLYRPEDSIGPHSDDERDLVPDTGIFSVSLGCPRVFHLDPRGGAAKSVALRLAHGSAIWMTGTTQRDYKHHVDAEKVLAEPALRVNLTFRCVRT